MAVKNQRSWMEEMVAALRSNAGKYELLAEAAQNLESRFHFQERAKESRYQAQCYNDCLDALREFASHIFSFDPFHDVC
jgi:hypothetical protein